MERIFSSVRRTAAALQSAAGGHSELGMAVYGAKCEGEGLRALGHHHIHAARSMKEWATGEENVCIQAVYVKLAELSLLQQELYVNYATQFHNQRKALKNILRREKGIDEAKKETEALKSKVTKLSKQAVQTRAARKADPQKVEAHDADLEKAKALEEEAVRELNTAKENQECFKFLRIKDSIKQMTAASRTFHQRSLQVLDTEDQLRNLLLPDKYAGCTRDAVTVALVEATNVVNDLAEALSLNKPASLVEKNSALEHLIRSDRMLNAEPLYEARPERELPDVDQLRRPLPLPPIDDLYSQPLCHPSDDSDSSDDDYEYTEPYQFHPHPAVDRMTRSPRPGHAPPPLVKPPEPPEPRYFGVRDDPEYTEMHEYDAPDQWPADGILPRQDSVNDISTSTGPSGYHDNHSTLTTRTITSPSYMTITPYQTQTSAHPASTSPDPAITTTATCLTSAPVPAPKPRSSLPPPPPPPTRPVSPKPARPAPPACRDSAGPPVSPKPPRTGGASERAPATKPSVKPKKPAVLPKPSFKPSTKLAQDLENGEDAQK